MSGNAKNPKRDWNELEFVSWKEFQEMAPAIVQLEITRIGKLLSGYAFDPDTHNVLVRVRFELKKFNDLLADADKDQVKETGLAHLQTALVSLFIDSGEFDPQITDTLTYIHDRIDYIYRRIPLIY